MRFDGWRLAPLVALAWPIVFFGDRVIPFRGTLALTQNDFIQLYWVYKAYLLDCLARFSLPLWSPSEGAGYPFYASPFTQTFYPLNLPLTVFHALAGGYSPHDHQVFTALGNGFFALGLYLWLRSLGNGAPAALLAACLISTSFRFGDMLRFPNAVHTALWYPWILLSFNRILAARRRWELARWAAALGGFLVCFLTAGYPYYVYYSIFLFPPYLLLAAAGGGLGGVPPASRSRLGLIAVTSALALGVCAPYLANVKQALDATAGRTAAVDHPWYVFGPIDSINSILFPVGASPDGCYYFGGAGLLLLVLYAAGIAGDRDARAERRLCVVLLAWCLVVIYISWGEGSLLFRLLERTLPGFSRLRVWGRFSILLLPAMGWLLARAFEHFQARLAAPVVGGVDPRRKAANVLLGALVVIAAVQGALLFSGYVHRYYTVYLTHLRGLAGWTLVGTALGFLALRGLIVVAGRRQPAGVAPATAVALVLAVSALDLWPVGARLWSSRGVVPERIPFDVAANVRRSPGVPRGATLTTMSLVDLRHPELGLSPAFNVGIIPEWYFQSYYDFVMRARREPAEMEYLLGGIDGRRLFQSARVDHERIRPFLDDCASFGGAFTIIDYTGDRMEAEVTMPAAGFVTFVDNWDPDWHARVDGAPTPIVAAFQTFKAAPVPAGRHRLVFEYVPRLWFSPLVD